MVTPGTLRALSLGLDDVAEGFIRGGQGLESLVCCVAAGERLPLWNIRAMLGSLARSRQKWQHAHLSARPAKLHCADRVCGSTSASDPSLRDTGTCNGFSGVCGAAWTSPARNFAAFYISTTATWRHQRRPRESRSPGTTSAAQKLHALHEILLLAL